MNEQQKNYRWILVIIALMIIGMAVLYFWAAEKPETKEDSIEESRQQHTPVRQQVIWKEGEGAALARKHCTPCHSAQLVVQNRMNAAGWEATIRWMQESQNLWDLGEDEEPLIAYLANNYAPRFEGRRKPLTVVEWYELD